MRYAALFSTLIASVLGATTLIQFPNGTWLENIALRSNGNVLLTELNPSPVLLQVDPSAAKPTAQVVYKFPAPATGLTGIAQLGSDVFYVVSLNYSFTTFQPTAGSGRLWRVNFSGYPTTSPAVSLVANLGALAFPNGATGVPGSSSVLIADFAAGKVFRVNVNTGAVDVAVNNAAVNVPSGAMGGVNGVHARGDGYLYYTNSGTHSYGRIPIDANGTPTGNAQNLFTNANVTPDDFALDSAGGANAAYIADSTGNRVVHVTGTSNAFTVSANINGSTSVAVGSKGVYISSTGGDNLYAQKPIPVGGALSKL